MQRRAPRPGPGTVKPMAGVIFSAIDAADVDVSRQQPVSDKTGSARADTPDSGQGGYFTQSETESGASGSQSPVDTTHHNISRDNRPQEQRQTDNRKTKSQLLGSYQDVSGRAGSQDRGGRLTGRPLTNTQTNKVNNNKAKLPPRPARTSSSLPPPVPKKLRDTRVDSRPRPVSLARRTVPPPERRPVTGRTLPLQIQSPSIVQALRAANSIRENKSSQAPGQNVNNPSVVPKRTPNVSPSKSARHVEKPGMNGHEKTADKLSSKLVQHQREDHRSKGPIKPSKNTKITSNGTVSSRVLKDPSGDTKAKTTKIATESLASRAKRQTEDKMKLLYSSLRSPKQERKLNFSDRRKKLQREEMMVTSNSGGESDFPKQPVQSLIKMYDKSKVKSVQGNKNRELKSTNCNLSSKPNLPVKTISATKSNPKSGNVVKSNKADETRCSQGQSLKNKPGSGWGNGASSDQSRQHLTKSNKETRLTSAKTNSIDEFLQSAKRTRQKYQSMLTGEGNPGKNTEQAPDNLGVKTDPSESDLQTGCFTDVTYAGYFARQPFENHQRLNDISICGNTSNLEEDQNKLCKQPGPGPVDQEAKTDGEEHLVGTRAGITQHSEFHETHMMPTPSPRLKKKQRREQFLQEHKQFGKNVLAIAKTNLEQDPVDHVLKDPFDKTKVLKYVRVCLIYLQFVSL